MPEKKRFISDAVIEEFGQGDPRIVAGMDLGQLQTFQQAVMSNDELTEETHERPNDFADTHVPRLRSKFDIDDRELFS